MGWYPVTLDLAGRRCVVIGGGAVSERKVEGLLIADARITVISPTLTPALAALTAAGRIVHVARRYRAGDLRAAALAFATSGDVTVNAAVSREGRRRGILVNAADDPANCDFILPSVLRRGDLTVAVSTGGAAPALARSVRERLEPHVGPDVALLTDVAADVRRELRDHGRVADAAAWQRALDAPLRHLVARGRRAAARQRLLSRLTVVPPRDGAGRGPTRGVTTLKRSV
jgi:precorrin-2 dehydrogenase/sirohydrochlorin ferrochelatase